MTPEDKELKLFTIKSKFFREIPHPKLILKAIAEVESLCAMPPMYAEHVIDFGNTDLAFVLKSHSEETIVVKTKLAHTVSPEELCLALHDLYCWHWSLILRLIHYLPQKELAVGDSIKQSTAIDSYMLYKFIRDNKLSEAVLKTYICKEIEENDEARFSILTRVCLQALKIVRHG
ncbi:MAG: hypothetical protein IPM74_02835 [Crocinitomicaceae bacterium]|nr:hypothetical protein [Crocinitomicaceae bacterium]MBK8924852.1 hypothetical protein [Crocinitomicaceae bacterium]